MKKRKNNIQIIVDRERNDITFWDSIGQREYDRWHFDDSVDFCKFFLEIFRDMGGGKIEFASACNQAVNEIEGWDSLGSDG